MEVKPKTSKALRSTRLEPYAFVGPVVILLLILFGYPLIKSIFMAFQSYKLTAMNNIHFIGLENFNKILSDESIGMVFKNSLIYVVASVGGQFLLGLTLALALKNPFRGRGIYQSFVFLPWAFSSFVVGIIFRWSFNGEYGIINTVLMEMGVISEKIAWLGTPGLSLLVVIVAMIWMGIPFFAILNLAALQSIPKEIYESAETDGCGKIRAFFAITMPYIKPTIIISLLLRTIWVFNSFDLIVVISGGGPASTSETLPSYMYSKTLSAGDLGGAAALGMMVMAILLVYSGFFLRFTQYNKAGDF